VHSITNLEMLFERVQSSSKRSWHTSNKVGKERNLKGFFQKHGFQKNMGLKSDQSWAKIILFYRRARALEIFELLKNI